MSFRAAVARQALRAFLSTPEPILRNLVGPLPRNDRGHELDLGTRAFLHTVARVRRPAVARTIAAMRHEMDAHAPLADFARCALRHVHDRKIHSHGHEIALRVYEPHDVVTGPHAARPICVYYHGGGFVTGSIRSHDGICSRIADRASSIVVSVEYRLAPEHPFPAATLDAIAAFEWVAEHAAELGGDPARMAVAGDSAGGNLAAVVAWHERDAAIAPRFQLLVYPTTDYVRESESRRLYREGFLHDEASIRWFRKHYFSGSGADPHHPMASIIRAPDLHAVAPACIVTAGFDPMRDDGERYAERLAQHGVPVDLLSEERLVHGFFSLGGILTSAASAIDRAIAALARGVRARGHGSRGPG
jgi:acetyl esterase